MEHWRLQGVIGSGDAWIGWLVHPEKQWRRLARGAVIRPEHWQVSRVDRFGATLVAVGRTERCDGEPAEVFLASPFVNESVAR